MQVVYNNHFLVRPNCPTGSRENNNKKDQPNATETATSPSTSSTEITPATNEFIFSEAVLLKVGKPLKEIIEKVCFTFRCIWLRKPEWKFKKKTKKQQQLKRSKWLTYDLEIKALYDPNRISFVLFSWHLFLWFIEGTIEFNSYVSLKHVEISEAFTVYTTHTHTQHQQKQHAQQFNK